MLLTKPGAWPSVLATFLSFTHAIPALASDKNPEVQWISPSAGDVFGPGDSILGKWNADTAVVSPAFKLCQGEPKSSLSSRSDSQVDPGSCGDKVYPTVQQSAGTYSISLAVPNTTTEQEWHLEMFDDFDNTWSSPSFSLSPSGSQKIASATGAQAPLSAASASTAIPVVTALPVPVEVASSASSTPMLATRTPLPVAAFAVPLSIVAAILLVAAFLSFRHNRKLAEERAQDLEKHLSRKTSLSSSFQAGFSRQSDIEHALDVLSKSQGQMPVPLFMPVDVPIQREPRRSTREAYYPKQYTEYCRPSHEKSYYNWERPSPEKSYRERPPSYRTAPTSSVTRSHSRARSLVSSISSHSRASNRTAVHPPSSRSYPEHRQHGTSITSDRSYRSSSHHHLPPVRAVSPLLHSSYEYDRSEDRNRQSISRYRDDAYEPRREDVGDVDCATHSVLDDYLFMDPSSKPQTLPPGLPSPPQCLMPAPQRLHVRNSGAVSPRSCVIEEEEDEEERGMTEVNLYDVVADSLKRARKG